MGEQDYKEIPEKTFEDVIETLASSKQGPITQSDLEKDVEAVFNSLPKLDRNKLRKEIDEMEYEVPQMPTTFDINKGLSITQSYKDRLTEILTLATREHRVRKRYMEMLVLANSVTSKQSSADKREGEAMLKYSVWAIQLEASEIFVKEVEQILANIKSASDAISRQGSMIQSQISLGEYVHRKHANVQSKNSEAEEKPDYHSGTSKIDIDW